MKGKIGLMLCLIIVGAMFLAACGQRGDTSPGQGTENPELKELKERVAAIDEEYDGSYNLHLHPEYPIVHVVVENPPLPTMPPDLVVYYGLDKGELHEQFKDEAFVESYEKSRGEILYGHYEGEIVAEVSYYPIKGGRVDGENTWKINDQEVSYIILTNNNQSQSIITGIELEKGGYWIRYLIKEEFGEDEARAFTEFLLKDLNR